MKIPGLRQWIWFVISYWLVTLAVVCLEILYMKMTWAGIPGFVLSLPLSVVVVTGYMLAAYASFVLDYDITITEYHVEYGFLVCAFLNAFLLYPFYWWWTARRRSQQERQLQQPPPPPSINV